MTRRISALALLLTATSLLCGCWTTVVRRAPVEEHSRFEVLVLGIAQDGGLPHVGCNKPCCERARKEGWALMPACIAVHDREENKLLLVEATPGIGAQLARLHRLTGENRGRRPVDAVMITHAHIGHYTGLMQFGKEVCSTEALPVHVSPRMASFLRDNGPWSQLVSQKQIDIQEFTPGKRFTPLPGITVEAISVPHRYEYSDTMAFRIFGPNRSVLFVPDVDSWSKQPGLLDSLLEGIDVAYIDGTFYDTKELPERIRAHIAHPPIVESMDLLEARAKERPGSIRFIHLNHTNPAITDMEVRKEIWKRGFRVARPGERIDI
jgi:pyrroloquinoline quinone biosynthesis protein B